MTKPVKRAGNKQRKPLDNWIRPELKRLYGKAYSKKGVDLNGDGKLQANEKITTHNNNNIPGYKKNQKNPYKKIIGDWTDWLAFYRANHTLIAAKAGKDQNSIFFWAAKFKSTNRIHIVTTIESALVKRKKVLRGYKKLWKILSLSRRIKVTDQSKFGKYKAKLLTVELAMKRSGITFISQQDSLLLDNLSNNQLDCDTSSYVFLAEADEQGWPIHLVSVPNHAFVRWDNNKRGAGRVRFNYGVNDKPSDKDYKRKISPEALRQKVYLENLDQKGFVSQILTNRANEFVDRGRYKEAAEDFSRAIALRPNFSDAYYNRGVIYDKLGKYDNALSDYNKALSLDPKSAIAYNNRGSTYFKLGKYDKALSDYNKALSLDPKNATTYHHNRALVYSKLGQYEKSKRAFEKAKLNSSLIRSKPSPIWLRLHAKLRLDQQLRYSPAKGIDSRTALGYNVNLFNFGQFNIGTLLEVGYSVGKKHHMLDVLGLVTLEGRFHNSSLRFEIGAGYNFLLSGKDDNAPIGDNGIFKYGLRYTHMFGHFGLSASVYVQHQFDEPGRPAILSGLGFVWDTRGLADK